MSDPFNELIFGAIKCAQIIVPIIVLINWTSRR
jgi:hypothetical protein